MDIAVTTRILVKLIFVVIDFLFLVDGGSPFNMCWVDRDVNSMDAGERKKYSISDDLIQLDFLFI